MAWIAGVLPIRFSAYFNFGAVTNNKRKSERTGIYRGEFLLKSLGAAALHKQ